MKIRAYSFDSSMKSIDAKIQSVIPESDDKVKATVEIPKQTIEISGYIGGDKIKLLRNYGVIKLHSVEIDSSVKLVSTVFDVIEEKIRDNLPPYYDIREIPKNLLEYVLKNERYELLKYIHEFQEFFRYDIEIDDAVSALLKKIHETKAFVADVGIIWSKNKHGSKTQKYLNVNDTRRKLLERLTVDMEIYEVSKYTFSHFLYFPKDERMERLLCWLGNDTLKGYKKINKLLRAKNFDDLYAEALGMCFK